MVHHRGVIVVENTLVVVVDQLESGSAHAYAQKWHLPPGADIDVVSEGQAIVRDEAQRTLLSIVELGSRPELQVEGGYYSEAYEVSVAAPVVTSQAQASNHTFVTLLFLDREPGTATLVRRGPRAMSVFVEIDGLTRQLDLDDFGADTETLEVISAPSG